MFSPSSTVTTPTPYTIFIGTRGPKIRKSTWRKWFHIPSNKFDPPIAHRDMMVKTTDPPGFVVILNPILIFFIWPIRFGNIVPMNILG